MGANKQLHHDTRHLQEEYLTDIDCSGGLYLEYQERDKQELKVTITNFGLLYKCFLNGKRIDKEELYKLLGINENTPLRLEHHVYVFEKNNKTKFKVEVYEIDVT
jgi:hypothetical protein